jgi:hypothetical protein
MDGFTGREGNFVDRGVADGKIRFGRHKPTGQAIGIRPEFARP